MNIKSDFLKKANEHVLACRCGNCGLCSMFLEGGPVWDVYAGAVPRLSPEKRGILDAKLIKSPPLKPLSRQDAKRFRQAGKVRVALGTGFR